jgi:hypothetical protein
MHISPQFHVVFDDQFTTARIWASELSDEFYGKLYQKATWMYTDKYADFDNLYHFNSCWSELPPPTYNENRGSKQKSVAPDIHNQSKFRPTNSSTGDPAEQISEPAAQNGEPALIQTSNPAASNGDPALSQVSGKTQLHAKLYSLDFQTYASKKGFIPALYTAHIATTNSSNNANSINENDQMDDMCYTFQSLLFYSSAPNTIECQLRNSRSAKI